jgi:hypothetical protein
MAPPGSAALPPTPSWPHRVGPRNSRRPARPLPRAVASGRTEGYSACFTPRRHYSFIRPSSAHSVALASRSVATPGNLRFELAAFGIAVGRHYFRMGRVLTVCLFVRKSRNDCCRETHAMWPRAPPSNLRKLLPPIPLALSYFASSLPARLSLNVASVAAEPRPLSRVPDFQIHPLFFLPPAF